LRENDQMAVGEEEKRVEEVRVKGSRELGSRFKLYIRMLGIRSVCDE